MEPSWLILIVAILAVYRVSLMIATEDGPFNIFEEFRKQLIFVSEDNWIVRGFQCPMCISFWLGIIAAFLMPFTTLWMLVTYALAISGGATFLVMLTGVPSEDE